MECMVKVKVSEEREREGEREIEREGGREGGADTNSSSTFPHLLLHVLPTQWCDSWMVYSLRSETASD